MRSATCGLLLAVCAASTAVAAASPAASALAREVRVYRQAHEKAIVEELASLVSIPNVATNLSDIDRNVDFLRGMLERRGFGVEVLSAGEGTPPSVLAERRTRGGTRTVVFYAHFDGQPVSQKSWISDPFDAVMRDGPPTPKARIVNWRATTGPLDPEWRLYGRSASDDKSPIVAILAALDALQALKASPRVNIKIFLEGEEERGSANLRTILSKYLARLSADLWILCDGPVHASGRAQVYMGARGVTDLELTAYGPLRPLHSGHYGNWAPNPAVEIAHLIARMRDEEGKILIPGFYDDVRPLTASERSALASVPDADSELKRELGLGRSEGQGPIMTRVMDPALNVRGIRSAEVGQQASNSIPTEARVSIDFRLVPDQTAQKVQERVETFLRSQGWFLTESVPDLSMRLAHPKVLRTEWQLSYAGARADISAPYAKAVVETIEQTRGERPIVLPMLGGSIPMSLFTEVLQTPVLGVPMVNHDNNQHGANENVRLQNLWDGIETYAGLLAGLDW